MAVKVLKRQDSAKRLDFAPQGFQGLAALVAKRLVASGERNPSFRALRRPGDGAGETTARAAPA
jgi:hypothetical protein